MPVVAAPTITASGTVDFVAGGAAVILDAAATVGGLGLGTMESATVSISGGFLAGDTLAVGAAGGLVAAYSNGVLTLTGIASVAIYDTALDSITYTSTAADPTDGNTDTVRTISWLGENTLNQTGPAQTSTIDVDTPPSVVSIDTVGASSNAGGTEQFTVTFSEAVTGVDTSDFTLADTGTVTGTINSISGSAASYTVTVTGATGTGTMGLDLKSSGTGITDAAGNAISGGFTSGQTFSIAPAAVEFDAHVYTDTNADGVQDNAETGLAGVTVNLLDGSGNPTGTSGTTDSNGDISFNTLPPGAYQLQVITPGTDVVSQSVNLMTPNVLAAGQTADAIAGVYAPPALIVPTLSLFDAEGASLGNIWSQITALGVDPNPASLKITTIGTSGTSGALVLDTAGQSLTYVATGFNPSAPVDAFTFTLADAGGGTATGTVDVTITGANLPTTVATTPGSTTTATGSGQRLISEATGQTLVGSSAGGDELFGGSDTDIIASGNGNTINVLPGNHFIAMGANDNAVTLNDGNNTVSATGTGNSVTGGNGNNIITGMQGDTTIVLGNGNNTITISGADNSITVGTGTNHINAGVGGDETVHAGDGANTISAGGPSDLITAGNGANKITATGASATITAGNGGNTVAASGAGDHITTGSGNDTILDTAGSAVIKAGLGLNKMTFAGSANDIINQGGSDTLTDNGTNNTFVFPLAGQGLDTINGSVLSNGDVFDLRSALAGTTWDQQLSDIGSYLSLGTSGANALVQLSVTSGGTPITIAVLDGAGAVPLSTFISHALLT